MLISFPSELSFSWLFLLPCETSIIAPGSSSLLESLVSPLTLSFFFSLESSYAQSTSPIIKCRLTLSPEWSFSLLTSSSWSLCIYPCHSSMDHRFSLPHHEANDCKPSSAPPMTSATASHLPNPDASFQFCPFVTTSPCLH
jgi:hypothetical protein